MKTMKWKPILLVCSLLLAATLVGCSRAPSVRPVDEPQKTADTEVSHEPAQIENRTDNSSVDEPQQTTEAKTSHEAEPTESGTDEPEKSLEEKALFAYQEILKAAPAIEGEYAELEDASVGYEENQALFGNHYELFALCDINQDDIPELIAQSTVNFRWTPISVYTYADGEAVLLKDPLDTAAHGTFEQNSSANGAYITYICEDSHIHSVWRGDTPIGEAEENYAYALEGTTLTEAHCTAGEGDNTIYFYDIAMANTAENVNAMVQ